MSNLNYKFTIILITIMAITNGCDKIYESGIMPAPNQPIAGAVEIGSEWIEITPPQPLRPVSESAVKIQYIGSDVHDSFTNDGTELILADGRKTKIEAILYDAQRKEYELGIVGLGSGAHLALKPVSESKNGKLVYSYPNFPEGKTFVKLKIRSQIPLKCEDIQWINTIRR